MAIVINGSGTVTGISVGGLPDGIVDAGTLATNSVDSAELIDGAVDNSHLADDAVDSDEIAAGAIDAAHLASGVGGTDNLSTTATGVDVTGTITDDSPFFFIRSTAIQSSIVDNVWTKVTLGTEDIDTAGACSSSRFTVPSGGAGIYYISANVFCNSQSSGNLFVAGARIYKNGSATFIQAESNNHDGRPETQSVFLGGYLNLAESDYIELYGAMNIWNNNTGSFNHPSFMSGGRVG